jgi:hypothetical protein
MNPSDQNINDTSAQWAYTSGNLVEPNTQALPAEPKSVDDQPGQVILSWSASEFVQHDKSNRWYFNLGVGAVTVAILTFVITRQILSAVVILLMAVMFGLYGRTKPKTLQYAVQTDGIIVGNDFLTYDTIKSFSVIAENGMPYVQILLQKRLSIPVNIYADPAQLDQVATILGQYIPYDQKKRDIADIISSRLRF